MYLKVERHFGDRSNLLRIIMISMVVVGVICIVASFPRLAQDINYHLFADTESMFGISNWSNVLSNLGFIIAGITGLINMRHMTLNTALCLWRFFFSAIILVGFGSAYYHWIPSNNSLFWDRLPMTMGFASLIAGMIQERFGSRAARLLFGPLVLTGAFSVLYWWFTEQAGTGDLRPYIVVQFLPMLLIPLIIILFPKDAKSDRPYWILLISYAVAKLFEWQDDAVFMITSHLISGHALKHLIAAGGLLLFRPSLLIDKGEQMEKNS
jgi:hypothetical protein